MNRQNKVHFNQMYFYSIWQQTFCTTVKWRVGKSFHPQAACNILWDRSGPHSRRSL